MVLKKKNPANSSTIENALGMKNSQGHSLNAYKFLEDSKRVPVLKGIVQLEREQP